MEKFSEMTDYQKEKLSRFIEDLIEFKFYDITFDSHQDKKLNYYSLDVDTLVPIKSTLTTGLVTQRVHFAVSPDSGMVLLWKDDYEEFRTKDLEFAKKYSRIISEAQSKKMTEYLDQIIDTTYSELKLQRDASIKKLIG